MQYLTFHSIYLYFQLFNIRFQKLCIFVILTNVKKDDLIALQSYVIGFLAVVANCWPLSLKRPSILLPWLVCIFPSLCGQLVG